MDSRYYVPGEGEDVLSIDNEPIGDARDMARLLGKKWTLDVLTVLEQRSRRFNELRRDVPDATAKVLTDRLAELVDAGLIDRREVGTNHVSYSIHPAAMELLRIAEELGCWKAEHIPEFGFDDAKPVGEIPPHDPYKRRTVGEGAGVETPGRQ